MLNVEAIREDFPIFKRQVNGHPLVYLDNSATSQKPRQVIEALTHYYTHYNSNIHRGVHTLSQEATEAYEQARIKAAKFINAPSERSVIFTRNTTESLNLVAYTWGEQNIGAGDEIVLSRLEHHSNLIPWQILAQKKGATLKFLPLTEDGCIEMSQLDSVITTKTKLVSVNHMSNAFGTINDIHTINKAAKAVGAVMVVDAAQSAPHLPTDVQDIGCDFLAFSSHKMLGPTGVGVLYGRESLLEIMPPFLGGGDMISEVWFDRFECSDLPSKFEAGTPNIADVIAFGAALDYLNEVGLENILEHEHEVAGYAIEEMRKMDGVTIYGPDDINQRGGVVSFNMKGTHAHDIGTILDHMGVAVRVGHHCAQPLMRHFGIGGTARASFYLYNTKAEVDQFLLGLKKVQEVFCRVPAR